MSRPQTASPPSTGSDFDNVVFAALMAAVGAGVILWLGAQVAAILHSHHHLVLDATATAAALKRVPGLMGDPRLAFEEPARSQLPGPILFWVCVALVLVACVAAGWALWRVFGPNRTPLDRRSRLGVPTEARLATVRDLRALIVRRPTPGRFMLGRFHPAPHRDREPDR